MAEFGKPKDFVAQPKLGKRERKTVSITAVGLTPASYTFGASGDASGPQKLGKLATSAIVQVLTNGINFTRDGTTATTALGFVAAANDLIYLNTTQEIVNFSAIRSGAADAAIEVEYHFGF